LKTLRLFLLVSVVTAPAIVGGSIVGAGFGWLKAGAFIGGVVGVLLAARVAVRLGLIPARRLWRTALGGIIGLATASGLFVLAGPDTQLPETVSRWLAPVFDTPLGPALTGLLVPSGALIGSRWKSTPKAQSREPKA
jgi:hypothetical protein